MTIFVDRLAYNARAGRGQSDTGPSPHRAGGMACAGCLRRCAVFNKSSGKLPSSCGGLQICALRIRRPRLVLSAVTGAAYAVAAILRS